MSKTTSCSCSSATTCPSPIRQKTDHKRFMERESRLIDAKVMLAFVREVLTPPEQKDDAHPIHSISFDALDGAVCVLYQVGDVLAEYHDIIDVCCEKQLIPFLNLEEEANA